MKKINLVCPECRSDNIYFDNSCVWDVFKQCFVMSDQYPCEGYCGECLAEFNPAKEIRYEETD